MPAVRTTACMPALQCSDDCFDAWGPADTRHFSRPQENMHIGNASAAQFMVRVWRGAKIWCLKLHGLAKIPDLPTIHNPIVPCRKKYIARQQPKVRRTRHPRMRCVEGQKIEAKRVLLKVRCAVHMVPYTLLSGLQGGGDPADRAARHAHHSGGDCVGRAQPDCS